MVAMLLGQGLGPRSICEALQKANIKGTSLKTIRGDIRWLDEQYKKQYVKDIAIAKHRVLSALDLHRSRAWDAFARSQRDEVVITEKHYKGQDGEDIIEHIERRRAQAGDARFLGEVRQNLSQVADLLGLSELRLSGELTLTGDKQYGGPEAMRALERMLEAGMGGQPMQTIDGEIIESHVAELMSSEEAEGNGKPKKEELSDE